MRIQESVKVTASNNNKNNNINNVSKKNSPPKKSLSPKSKLTQQSKLFIEGVSKPALYFKDLHTMNKKPSSGNEVKNLTKFYETLNHKIASSTNNNNKVSNLKSSTSSLTSSTSSTSSSSSSLSTPPTTVVPNKTIIENLPLVKVVVEQPTITPITTTTTNNSNNNNENSSQKRKSAASKRHSAASNKSQSPNKKLIESESSSSTTPKKVNTSTTATTTATTTSLSPKVQPKDVEMQPNQKDQEQEKEKEQLKLQENKDSTMKIEDLSNSTSSKQSTIKTPEKQQENNTIIQQFREMIDKYRSTINSLEEKLELSGLETNSLKQELFMVNSQYHQDTNALLEIINEHETTIQDLNDKIEDLDQTITEEEQEGDDERDGMVDDESGDDAIQQSESEMEDSDDDAYEEEVLNVNSAQVEKLQDKINCLKDELLEAEEYSHNLRTENQQNLELIDKYRSEITDCQSLVVYYKEELEKKSLDNSILSKKLQEKNEEIVKYKQRIQNFKEMIELQKELNGLGGSAGNNSPLSTSMLTSSNGPLSPLSTNKSNQNNNRSLMSRENSMNHLPVNPSPLKKSSMSTSFKTPQKRLDTSVNRSSTTGDNSITMPVGKSKTPRKVLMSPKSIMDYI
eukprot:gene6066-7556_t